MEQQLERPGWNLKGAAIFVAIGLALYVAVFVISERLVYRTGDSNPFYKITTAEHGRYDWVILGASHAMPLDFDDFNTFMETGSGRTILNLASPGTGPLYNRFVLERFLSTNRTGNVLIIVDSFAFRSPDWNEERFTDAKLLARVPFDIATARLLLRYVEDGVDARAVLDYVSGFSKINNRNRLKRDVWEGEAKFDRTFRPSSVADNKRIDYLFPVTGTADDLARYLDALVDLVTIARAKGTQVTVVKPPIPARFRKLLPDEAAFDTELTRRLDRHGIAYHDLSTAIDEPKYYFDTDHLNRNGATLLYQQFLKPILVDAGS
jgi:hypothetical protein